MNVQKGANAFPPKSVPFAAAAESSDDSDSSEEEVFISYLFLTRLLSFAAYSELKLYHSLGLDCMWCIWNSGEGSVCRLQ